MAHKPYPIEDRFWPKVDKSAGPDACWPWIAHKAWNGYGEFRMPTNKGKLLKAHRVSYMLLIGPVPDNLDLDHLCRNRACVNPAHLEPVTRAVNATRGDCGKHNQTLNADNIKEIRSLRNIETGVSLSNRFGVSRASISRIQLHKVHKTIK